MTSADCVRPALLIVEGVAYFRRECVSVTRSPRSSRLPSIFLCKYRCCLPSLGAGVARKSSSVQRNHWVFLRTRITDCVQGVSCLRSSCESLPVVTVYIHSNARASSRCASCWGLKQYCTVTALQRKLLQNKRVSQRRTAYGYLYSASR